MGYHADEEKGSNHGRPIFRKALETGVEWASDSVSILESWIFKDVAKDIIECSKIFIFYEARAWLYTTGTKKSQSKKLWCS